MVDKDKLVEKVWKYETIQIVNSKVYLRITTGMYAEGVEDSLLTETGGDEAGETPYGRGEEFEATLPLSEYEEMLPENGDQRSNNVVEKRLTERFCY